ncbi:MAG: DUF86 domain-containing protein [Candidatus Bathyarchaeia archaeon]
MPVDVNQLKQRITEVLDAKAELKRLTSKPYQELTGDEKSAIRYHVIILAEALGSICIHIAIEDVGETPDSFSACFDILEKEGICESCSNELSSIVKLRNLLTHRYWIIDDHLVYDSIRNGFYAVDKFLESVEDKYAIEL